MTLAKKVRGLRFWLALALVVGAPACGGSAPIAAASPSPTLTAAEASELARLEARPIILPAIQPGGQCPSTSLTKVDPFADPSAADYLYGSGPVYARGGPQTNSATNSYNDVVYFADPTVRGFVLVRIQTIDGRYKGFFVGNFAAGPVIGIDTINGKRVDLYGEVALPLSRPSGDTNLATGWTSWHVRQGIDRQWTCVGIQVDSESGTEMVVVSG